MLGTALLRHGKIERTEQVLRAGLEAASSSAASQSEPDLQTNMMRAHSNLGWLLADGGRLAEARQHLDEALRLAETSRTRYRVAGMWLMQATASHFQGEFERAVSEAERGLALSQELEMPEYIHHNMVVLNAALLMLDRASEALVGFEDAFQAFEWQVITSRTTLGSETHTLRSAVSRMLIAMPRRPWRQRAGGRFSTPKSPPSSCLHE
jgi:tetratricopeptide (TPR) repeat protein